MNTEVDRPYACSAPGCTQRFPTEDHLIIHRHKHEMSLKFPSIKKDGIMSGVEEQQSSVWKPYCEYVITSTCLLLSQAEHTAV
ncbi:hypothetical protein SKAU_G00407630 [Synaphobranchus kaupii]|uniref:C2H2-type domain-containing protein n=1 Tax=Synaphobranchus kaupii TaxID=118154 RepID=A0A9Q1EA98_SYNKA|nr:hypothetical protein SKAU_G00407630 [Synaphobranchus kaupii]